MNGLDFGTAIGLIKGIGSPDPAVIESAVSDWLDDHPEATTTVQDGSITKAKLDSNLQGTVDDVANLKSQKDYSVVVINEITKNNGYLMGDGTWGNFQGNYKHVVIPVSGGETIDIETPSAFMFGALTSYSIPSNGDSVHYSSATGFTARKLVGSTIGLHGTLPNDTRYVALCIVDNNVTKLPSKCKIGYYDYAKSNELAAILNSIDNVTDEKISSATYTHDAITDWDSAYTKSSVNLFSENGIIYPQIWNVGSFNYDRSVIGTIPNENDTSYARKKTGLLIFPVDITIKLESTDFVDIVCTFSADGKLTGYLGSNATSNQPTYKSETIVVPANTYIRVLFSYANTTTHSDIRNFDPNGHITFGFYQLAEVLYPQPDPTETPISWIAMGDSITEGYYSWIDDQDQVHSAVDPTKSWAYLVSKLNKRYVLTNEAIGGTGYVRMDNQPTARKIVDDIDFSNADLVTIAYGINDWKGDPNSSPVRGYPIGSMSDVVGTDNTLIANMRYFIEKIINDNKYCKIIIITPLNCYYSANTTTEENNYAIGYDFPGSGTLEDIFEAEKAVCEFYGIEYIDMTHFSIVNRKNLRTVLPDGIHPSELCHEFLANELVKKIMFG